MQSARPATQINRFKLHYTGSDVPALRLQMANALSTLDVAPVGMPPSAILFVRRMTHQLPDAIQLNHNRVSFPFFTGKQRNEWQYALRDQLNAYYRMAKRPVNGVLPRDAEVVLFSDESELLAGFCRDVITGCVDDKWWWKKHFKSVSQANALKQVVILQWVEAAHCVPAVIHLLAQWRCAIEFVNKLDKPSCQQLISAVIEKYHLHLFDEGDYSEANNEIERWPSNERREASYSRHAAPPWAGLFAEEIWQADLNRDQAALLGIARLLYALPEVIRSPAYQTAVRDWYCSASTVDATRARPSKTRSACAKQHAKELAAKPIEYNHRTQTRLAENEPLTALDHDVPAFQSNNGFFESTISNHPESGAEGYDEENRRSDLNAHQLEARDVEKDIDSGIRAKEVSQTNETPFLDTLSPQAEARFIESEGCAQQTAMESSVIDDEEEPGLDRPDALFQTEVYYSARYVDTELAGLFYLINLFQQLDIPECLSDQYFVDQTVSPWLMLNVLSRVLLADDFQYYREDPIWQALSKLDGSLTKSVLGKGLVDLEAYAIPEKWFRYFSSTEHRHAYWAHNESRLRLWMDEGVIAECKLMSVSGAEEQAFSLLKQYSEEASLPQLVAGEYQLAPVMCLKALTSLDIDPAFSKLISFLHAPIQRYLNSVLGFEDADSKTLLKELITYSGRVYLSSSHIDVVMDINDSNFNIRCSGLDQNPGWLPEYGRVVLFHYTT